MTVIEPVIEPLEGRRLLAANFAPLQLGGLGPENGFDGDTSIALAPDGTVTVAGVFAGTTDFAPGPAVVERTASGSGDAFVARYTPNGVLLWVDTFGGDIVNDRLEDLDERDFVLNPFRGQLLPVGLGQTVRGVQQLVTDVAIDDDGNAYVTAAFRGRIELAGASLAADSSEDDEFYDGLLLKYDPEGTLQFAQQLRGPFDEVMTSVDIDADGNPVVGGSFARLAQFADGAGATVFNPRGREDGFVAIFSRFNGNPVLVSAVGSDAVEGDLREQVTDVAVTPDGGVAAVGSFAGEADFDPGEGRVIVESVDLTDGFTLKLGPTLGFEWVTTYGGEELDGTLAVAARDDGSVYTAGYFQERVDVQPGPGAELIFADTSEEDFHTDLLVQRVTPSGVVLWSSPLNGDGIESVGDLAVDSRGVATLTGGFFGRSFDVAPGPSTVALTSALGPDDFEEFDTNDRDDQSYDGYAVQLSPNGRFVDSYQAFDRGDSFLTGLAIDEARGKVYVTGFYNSNLRRGAIDLNDGPRTFLLETEDADQSLVFTLALDGLSLV